MRPGDHGLRVAAHCAVPPQDQDSESREITGKLGMRRKRFGMSGLRGHGAEEGLTAGVRFQGNREQGIGSREQGAGNRSRRAPIAAVSLHLKTWAARRLIAFGLIGGDQLKVHGWITFEQRIVSESPASRCG